MKHSIPFGDKTIEFELPASAQQVVTACASDPAPTKSWEEWTAQSLTRPIGAPRLDSLDLRGKTVAVITDDHARPTPTYRVIPAVLDALHRAGARDEDITFVTGTGMHTPMTIEETTKKLGADIMSRYRVVIHDAVDRSSLMLSGITKLGNPVWVNKAVGQADFKIAIGRVALHSAFGYEGGGKAIMPGVVSAETILRNHSMNFSYLEGYATHETNPSRQDANDVAGVVGLDYIVNLVVNRKNEPFWCAAGHYLQAHEAAIAYGDQHVWGAEIGRKGDITIVSPGPSPDAAARAPFNGFALDMGVAATRLGGSIILPAPGDAAPPRFRNAFGEQMANMSFEEVILMHESRIHEGNDRAAHECCKNLRGEFYSRRPFRWWNVMLAGGAMCDFSMKRYGGCGEYATMQEAVDAAFAKEGPNARVVVLPNAGCTLPLERFHQFAPEAVAAGAR